MARSTRSTTLETRSARLRLPVSGKPKFVRVAKQLGLGYRRNKSGGVWVMRVADGKRGNSIRTIGAADDFDDADGVDVLTFWQAQDKVRLLARENRATAIDPVTVEQALASYEGDLKTRGGDIANVVRVRTHLTGTLARRMVVHLTTRDLRGWRDDLAKTLAPATVNRTCAVLKPHSILWPARTSRSSIGVLGKSGWRRSRMPANPAMLSLPTTSCAAWSPKRTIKAMN